MRDKKKENYKVNLAKDVNYEEASNTVQHFAKNQQERVGYAPSKETKARMKAQYSSPNIKTKQKQVK